MADTSSRKGKAAAQQRARQHFSEPDFRQRVTDGMSNSSDHWQDGSQPSSEPVRPPVGQTSYQMPYTARYADVKDHVAAGLLGIFLGAFGVHKFYLGYSTAGFIMLGVTILGSIVSLGFAGAVVWLIGVIEGIIYLTRSQSEFDALYVYGMRDWF